MVARRTAKCLARAHRAPVCAKLGRNAERNREVRMPRRSVIIAACVLLPMAAAVATDAAAQSPSFPSGYGYMDPSEIEQLNRAVAAGDHSTVRRHGWRLWAGIMQPSAAGWPCWYAWPNTKNAFLPPVEASPANANEASTSSAQAGPKKSL